MARLSDLTGQRFGRLTVLRRAEREEKNAYWICRCDCSNERTVMGGNLQRGLTRSCRCLSKEVAAARATTHGYTTHHKIRTEYMIWSAMLRRCLNPNCVEFKNYGGRGISVCERWRKFENFLQDMGDRPPGLTLDRIDNDSDYTPENCRWGTRGEQARNTRSNRMVQYGGREIRLIDAIDSSGLPYTTVYTRVDRGWPEDRWFLPKLR